MSMEQPLHGSQTSDAGKLGQEPDEADGETDGAGNDGAAGEETAGAASDGADGGKSGAAGLSWSLLR